jgi:hypothetical protein
LQLAEHLLLPLLLLLLDLLPLQQVLDDIRETGDLAFIGHWHDSSRRHTCRLHTA